MQNAETLNLDQISAFLKLSEDLAWMNAVMSMKGDPGGNMSVADAISMIHATPPDARSSFAREIWNIRRQGHGAKGREEVPF